MTKEKDVQIKKLGTVQEVLSSLQMSLKVPKGEKNTFGNYNYRKAEGILEAVKDKLEEEKYPPCSIKNRLSLVCENSRLFIKCVAVLKMGKDEEEAEGFAEIEETKKGMDKAQITGSATSYAKKYALCNLFAIDDSKDDPDAGENKEEKPKNQFSGLAKVADADMKATLASKNETEFGKVKKLVEKCESLKSLIDVWNAEQKIIKSLEKYAPKLFVMLNQSKDMMKKAFNQANELEQPE
jgi:hypothetical protein